MSILWIAIPAVVAMCLLILLVDRKFGDAMMIVPEGKGCSLKKRGVTAFVTPRGQADGSALISYTVSCPDLGRRSGSVNPENKSFQDKILIKNPADQRFKIFERKGHFVISGLKLKPAKKYEIWLRFL